MIGSIISTKTHVSIAYSAALATSSATKFLAVTLSASCEDHIPSFMLPNMSAMSDAAIISFQLPMRRVIASVRRARWTLPSDADVRLECQAVE